MDLGLMSGEETPCGMRSKFDCSFWFSFTRLFSTSSPTLKRTMARLSPGREVE